MACGIGKGTRVATALPPLFDHGILILALQRLGAVPALLNFRLTADDLADLIAEGGIEAAYKRQLAEAEDPALLRAELNARIESARGPMGPLNKFQIEEMIDPRDTRKLICEWVDTAYQMVSQPGRLGPRALQFRP